MDKARKELIEKVKAAMELQKRREANPLNWYLPNCAVHGGRKPDDWPLSNPWYPTVCPVIPCPESKHTKFHLSDKRLRVVFGGNRSAKTFTCMKEFLFRMACVRHPLTKQPFGTYGRRGRVLAQDFSMHEKKHIPEIKEWIPVAALKHGSKAQNKAEAWEKSYDSRNHILHLINDGWIDFLTYDQDPSKGESVDLDAWFADEEIPEDWYNACNSRLITRDGIGIMGVTPLYGLTWAMRFLDQLDPNVEVFKWGIRDNPYNSQRAIETFLSGVSPMEREARESGDFIEFKGIRYKELDRSVHVIGHKLPQAGWPVLMAMDPHQRKGTAIVWAFVDPHDDVVFFDELEISGTVAEVIAAIKAKEKEHKVVTRLRVIDPAANKQISGFGSEITTLREFQDKGMDFTLAYNNEAGYSVVEEYLHWDKQQSLSALNRPSCYFTEAVAKTWYSMTHLMWDEFKFGQGRDPKERVKDKDKDFADCVRYVLTQKPTRRQSIEPVSLQFRGF